MPLDMRHFKLEIRHLALDTRRRKLRVEDICETLRRETVGAFAKGMSSVSSECIETTEFQSECLVSTTIA